MLLAQVTDDLYDERESVHAYLEQFAVKILPENDYPQGGIDFAAALEGDWPEPIYLSRCSATSPLASLPT